MRFDEQQYSDLLAFDDTTRLISVAGVRALLIDAVALGMLRQNLLTHFGVGHARMLLTQFGFAQGWLMARAMTSKFNFADDAASRKAGTQTTSMEGLFSVQAGAEDILGSKGVVLTSSFESEQHLLHSGRSDSAVCWTISGLMSGYASFVQKEVVHVTEDTCIGRGDECCHMTGRLQSNGSNSVSNKLPSSDVERSLPSEDMSMDSVIRALRRVVSKSRVTEKSSKRVTQKFNEPAGLIARSSQMKQLIFMTRRVANVNATVLITGESGVGKERIARLLHSESSRVSCPFVSVNCAAISETLLESELFGHARGAFTGAVSSRPGLFEAAHKGTILLDEIGEISPGMQVKLLRVLQEREVRRVGENVIRPIDVRIIAATNRDLATAVTTGTFRQDLYYRLNVVELQVPPLRDRIDDILPLARDFLSIATRKMNRSLSGFHPDVLRLLLRYHWPGNVRELENAMERAVAFTENNQLVPRDLPAEIQGTLSSYPAPAMTTVKSLADVERRHILEVLASNFGNQTRTAEQLAIGTATLYRKLKAYNCL